MSVSEMEPDVDTLLEYLKNNRGFDFTGYKRVGLLRRIQKRMQAVEIESYTDYTDYLEVHPEEFSHLFNTILINVTGFFRDAPAWEAITNEIVPQIIAAKRPTDPIRVWSAGCASGEEAYTLAMVLAEALGLEQFRDRVKIYATDADEEALNWARQASYQAKETTAIPPHLLERYFEPSDTRYVFRKDLRHAIIFGRHDLIQDAPISRIDLLVCRNVLMYFNAETQARILSRFHFALNEGGVLFLGKAEILFTHLSNFTPVDLKRRIFRKVPKNSLRSRSLLAPPAEANNGVVSEDAQAQLRESSFDAGTVAQIVVDVNGYLTLANESARALFGLISRDFGRPLQDMDFSYRPVELRSCIERAYTERRSVNLTDVEWPTNAGELRWFDVQVQALSDASGRTLGATITFDDVSRTKRLREEVEYAKHELETAYEELQSTNEELETTNEELQSTVEELETTNEEMQSTNEELETMNEEMQSTNEELQTVNDEVRRRSDALNHLNAFLESILTSLRSGVAVLDRDLKVDAWNHRAEDLWGLRAEEVVGTHFMNLDIGLPVDRLWQTIRACLAGEEDHRELDLEATNRRGRAIRCHLVCTTLRNADSEIRGVILLMDDNDP